MGIHSQVLSINELACSPCLLPSTSFTISGKKIKSYCHGTDLKIKTVPCIFTVAYVFGLSECTCIFCHITSTSHDSPYAFLSGKPEMSIDSSTSMSGNNTLYLLTLQVNCATIDKKKTQRRRDHSRLALTIFVFLRE